MKVLVTTATGKEMRVVKKNFKDLGLKKVKLDFLVTGVGSYNVVESLSKFFVEKGKPDFVLNIGVVGYVKDLGFEVFQVYRIVEKCSQKEYLVPQYFDLFEKQAVLSVSKIVKKKSELKCCGEKFNFVDMESAAMEFMCNKYNISRAYIKVLGDKVDEEKDYDKIAENLNKIDYLKIRKFLESGLK